MKKSVFAVAFALMASFAGSASAEQVLFTKAASKSGASVAIDYVSDGRAVGLQLEIGIPGKAQVDLSKFARDLPKGFTAEHNIVGNKLIALIVNDRSQPLPEGIVSLGSIRSVGGSGEFTLERIESVDASAQVLSVETIQ